MRLLTLFFSVVCLSAFGQSEGNDFATIIAQHRTEYKHGFLTNPRSPLDSSDLDKLRFFEPNEKYRVACTFQRTPDEKPFDMPTSSGITKLFVKYGLLSFNIDGQKLHLAVYKNMSLGNNPLYANHLFLPFRDATNEETTYGGGRYIDLTLADVEAAAPVIDFNKCYNPWCHYSDGFNCPIPPSENSLDIAILAGEMSWVGKRKH